MALPININELLNGKTIEWERIEFREGWNPERTLRTICAFANDFNNWGGGYIILGLAENNGQPVFPPAGLELNQIDAIQKKLNQICRRIIPNYFPIVEPVDFQNRKILILWCPGGSIRPYKAPDSLGEKPQYFYYIRRLSSTVQPNRDEEHELLLMSNRVPFDDQVNQKANLSDFDINEIKIFLNEINSELENEIHKISINDLARRMNIVEGADEHLLPKNVGLLFFAKNPQKFFPQANIEIVSFKDEDGTEYTEKIFSGQIHNQLKGALNYIKDMIIIEKIRKISGIPEADRFFNYPYQAIEEALCNAVYHRGYDNDSPIEVRIFPTRIEIISFPGPLPPMNTESLQKFSFNVRRYRNRRIGEFLKELHLTEGRSTGIPKILRTLEKNGSPKPIFETDEERIYFKTTFTIHQDFKLQESDMSVSNQQQDKSSLGKPWDKIGTKVGPSADKDKLFVFNNLLEAITILVHLEKQTADYDVNYVKNHINQNILVKILTVLEFCITPQNRIKILSLFNLANNTRNYKSHIVCMIKNELLKMTIPDKPKSPNQKYVTTEKGKKILEIINNGIH